jgi:urea transport system substrate-binding protein
MTAEHLLDRSEWLLTAVGRYFTDLDHGAVKVGILHSLSGTMTASERPLQRLLVMLIEEQNARGGLLGRPVEAVIMNPRSDWKVYADQARAMLVEHKVAAIFGCWTSASRKQVLPVVEKENGLLFYPSQYEGEEESSCIFYTGGTPRQQALPAVDYLLGEGRKRFFLVGTDYIYPRTTNAIIRGYLASKSVFGKAVTERYVPFGENEWKKVAEEIVQFGERGEVAIVSTVSGDANVPFFRELLRAGVKPPSAPVMALSIGEAELPALTAAAMNGQLVAWNYLQSLETPENRDFIARFRAFTASPNAVVNDAMEATYIGFKLWAAAVEVAGTVDVNKVRTALGGLQVKGLTGFTVKLDASNHHLHKPVVIGRVENGRIVPVSVSKALAPPEPWSPWLGAASTHHRDASDATAKPSVAMAAGSRR